MINLCFFLSIFLNFFLSISIFVYRILALTFSHTQKAFSQFNSNETNEIEYITKIFNFIVTICQKMTLVTYSQIQQKIFKQMLAILTLLKITFQSQLVSRDKSTIFLLTNLRITMCKVHSTQYNVTSKIQISLTSLPIWEKE